MRVRHLMLAVTVGTLLGISGCGGGSPAGSSPSAPPPPPPPPPPTSQSLDTSQVLMQAKQTSETSSPYPVDNGALTLTDTSETSAPISVNSAQ
jgi:hypothetical protein